MNETRYVIKGRFTARPSWHPDDVHLQHAYLGKGGRWCSADQALTFSSPMTGETVLHETWSRLRNAGDHSIILSVEKFPCGNENADRMKDGS